LATEVDENPNYQTTPMLDAYRGEDMPDNQIWGTAVKYLAPQEREAFRLRFKDGLIFGADGSLFDTSEAVSLHSSTPKAIFVMDATGEFFAAHNQIIGQFHHSSLAAGEPVAAAGELLVLGGLLIEISNKSGHYRPGRLFMDQAIDSLARKGVELTGEEIDFVGH
jgi:hypothetical protein